MISSGFLTASSPAVPVALDGVAPDGVRPDWDSARVRLRQSVGAAAFDGFLGSLHLEAIDGDVARLSVPTRFLRQWIERHYLGAIGAALGVGRVTIAVRSMERPAAAAPVAATRVREAGRPGPTPGRVCGRPSSPVPGDPPAAMPSPLDPRLTFASFAVGTANALAAGAARAVAGGDACADVVLLHGETGLGKTHLLQAIAHEIADKVVADRAADATRSAAVYLGAEQTSGSFVAAARRNGIDAWRAALLDAAVLLIDDVHVLGGSKAIQVELVGLIDRRAAAGRVTVLAADQPAADLAGDERLRSRLAGGLSVRIGRPDAGLRREIVVRKLAALADRHAGFALPADVVDLVVEQVAKSPRDLEGALARLVMRHTIDGHPPDRDAAATAIADMIGETRRPVRVETIQRVVARRYGVSRPDILSARRTATVVRPRQIAMWLAKQMTLKSLPELGRLFGGRDHTTVLHAVRKLETLIGDDAALADELADLRAAIEGEG